MQPEINLENGDSRVSIGLLEKVTHTFIRGLGVFLWYEVNLDTNVVPHRNFTDIYSQLHDTYHPSPCQIQFRFSSHLRAVMLCNKSKLEKEKHERI